jgi:hypothetical protein
VALAVILSGTQSTHLGKEVINSLLYIVMSIGGGGGCLLDPLIKTGRTHSSHRGQPRTMLRRTISNKLSNIAISIDNQSTYIAKPKSFLFSVS